MAILIPFVGALIKSIHDAQAGQAVAAKTQAISNELSQLSNEKSNLRNKEWKIHVRLTYMQLKLASIQLEKGEMLSLKRSQVVLDKFPYKWSEASE